AIDDLGQEPEGKHSLERIAPASTQSITLSLSASIGQDCALTQPSLADDEQGMSGTSPHPLELNLYRRECRLPLPRVHAAKALPASAAGVTLATALSR